MWSKRKKGEKPEIVYVVHNHNLYHNGHDLRMSAAAEKKMHDILTTESKMYQGAYICKASNMIKEKFA